MRRNLADGLREQTLKVILNLLIKARCSGKSTMMDDRLVFFRLYCEGWIQACIRCQGIRDTHIREYDDGAAVHARKYGIKKLHYNRRLMTLVGRMKIVGLKPSKQMCSV